MASFLLPLDKPVGPTSHDMVALARRHLGTKRIGHSGTLDPFASGLLLLCVGQATRLAEYLTVLSKSYRAVARLDGSTTTDDQTGDRLATSDSWRGLSDDKLRAAFASQVGTIQQRPATFSARKVAGKRAYDLARRGEVVELRATEVTIHTIRIVSIELPEVRFEVDCSSGTYVRAIARDVGAQLGTGGYLSELRRTRIGSFDVGAAIEPAELSDPDRIAACRISMADGVRHLPQLVVSEHEQAALGFGQLLVRAAPVGELALTRDGELIAIGLSDGERIRPKKVFSSD